VSYRVCRLIRGWLVVLVLGLFTAQPSWSASALWDPQLKQNSLAPDTGRRTDAVDQAIRLVRKKTGGRVLAATAVDRPGRKGVNVRILLDGERVSTLFVNSDGRIQRR